MLLVIDVGNTSIVFGVYHEKELIQNFRIASDQKRTSDEYGLIFYNLLSHAGIEANQIDDVIVSSVVPNLMHTLPSMIIKYFNRRPIIVNMDLNYDLNILYDNPSAVGADRIVNAVAALEKYGGPCIIIDIGTAMTFCAVDGKRNYLGGAIFPGIGISAEALFSRTSKLPRIEIIKKDRVIQTDTVSSIQSGLYHGFNLMIDGIIEKMMEEEGWQADTTNIISTGGFSALLTHESKFDMIIDRDLTLEGLRIIYEMNSDVILKR
ncbi:type III pantothenate kinase [Peptoniphilus equinus]|uniref:Type III pantothenate kinase n=1 Tax=Peptoniphilus equinus TaxID=3016343 RepID=A0ABY7QW90_9FIRM|nr:type III pantothenate kinase [Peptoniphilus equinus]WBW50483.1 type III pantothenate kinase [Peptoniphilus equinus]